MSTPTQGNGANGGSSGIEEDSPLTPTSSQLRDIRRQKQANLRARMAARKDSQRRMTLTDSNDSNNGNVVGSPPSDGSDALSPNPTSVTIDAAAPVVPSSSLSSLSSEVKSALSPTGRRKSIKSVKVVSPSEVDGNGSGRSSRRSAAAVDDEDDNLGSPSSSTKPQVIGARTGPTIRTSVSADFDSKRPASAGDMLPELPRQPSTTSAAEKRARVRAKQQQSRSLSQYAGSLLVNNAKTRNNATLKLQNLTLKLGLSQPPSVLDDAAARRSRRGASFGGAGALSEASTPLAGDDNHFESGTGRDTGGIIHASSLPAPSPKFTHTRTVVTPATVMDDNDDEVAQANNNAAGNGNDAAEDDEGVEAPSELRGASPQPPLGRMRSSSLAVTGDAHSLMTELAKAYKVIAEREDDIKLAGQIGQMTCEENVRLEGVVAELSASLQAELDRSAELERKCQSLRTQCDELAQHNLSLVEEHTKTAQDYATEDGTLAEFFENELGKDIATGDIAIDLAAFKKHLNKQRRQQKSALHALEDTAKGLQDEHADLVAKMNEAQKERDTLRTQREVNEKLIEELKTKLLDKDMEMMSEIRTRTTQAQRAVDAVVAHLEEELSAERDKSEHLEITHNQLLEHTTFLEEQVQQLQAALPIQPPEFDSNVSFERTGGRRLELRVSDSHIDPGLTTPAPSLQTMIDRERGVDNGITVSPSIGNATPVTPSHTGVTPPPQPAPVFTFSPATVANSNSPPSPYSTPLAGGNQANAANLPAFTITPPVGTQTPLATKPPVSTPATPLDPKQQQRPLPSSSTPSEPVPVGNHHQRQPSVDIATAPVTIPAANTGTVTPTPNRRASGIVGSANDATILGKSPPPIRTPRENPAGPIRTGGGVAVGLNKNYGGGASAAKKGYLSLPRPMSIAEQRAAAASSSGGGTDSTSPSSSNSSQRSRSPPTQSTKSPSHGRLTPRIPSGTSIPRASPSNVATPTRAPVEASSTSVGFNPVSGVTISGGNNSMPPSPNRSGLTAAMESHQSKLEEEVRHLRVLHGQSQAAADQYKLQLAEVQKERATVDSELKRVSDALSAAELAVITANAQAVAATEKMNAAEKQAAAAIAAVAAAAVAPVSTPKNSKEAKEIERLTGRITSLEAERLTLQHAIEAATSVNKSQQSQLDDLNAQVKRLQPYEREVTEAKESLSRLETELRTTKEAMRDEKAKFAASKEEAINKLRVMKEKHEASLAEGTRESMKEMNLLRTQLSEQEERHEKNRTAWDRERDRLAAAITAAAAATAAATPRSHASPAPSTTVVQVPVPARVLASSPTHNNTANITNKSTVATPVHDGDGVGSSPSASAQATIDHLTQVITAHEAQIASDAVLVASLQQQILTHTNEITSIRHTSTEQASIIASLGDEKSKLSASLQEVNTALAAAKAEVSSLRATSAVVSSSSVVNDTVPLTKRIATLEQEIVVLTNGRSDDAKQLSLLRDDTNRLRADHSTAVASWQDEKASLLAQVRDASATAAAKAQATVAATPRGRDKDGKIAMESLSARIVALEAQLVAEQSRATANIAAATADHDARFKLAVDEKHAAVDEASRLRAVVEASKRQISDLETQLKTTQVELSAARVASVTSAAKIPITSSATTTPTASSSSSAVAVSSSSGTSGTSSALVKSTSYSALVGDITTATTTTATTTTATMIHADTAPVVTTVVSLPRSSSSHSVSAGGGGSMFGCVMCLGGREKEHHRHGHGHGHGGSDSGPPPAPSSGAAGIIGSGIMVVTTMPRSESKIHSRTPSGALITPRMFRGPGTPREDAFSWVLAQPGFELSDADRRALDRVFLFLNYMWELALSTFSKDHRKQPPAWLPDNESAVCNLCDKRYGLLTRRHHCRLCGQIFCNDCTSYRSNVAKFKLVNQRVCNLCFGILQALRPHAGPHNFMPFVKKTPDPRLALAAAREADLQAYIAAEARFALDMEPDSPSVGSLHSTHTATVLRE